MPFLILVTQEIIRFAAGRTIPSCSCLLEPKRDGIRGLCGIERMHFRSFEKGWIPISVWMGKRLLDLVGIPLFIITFRLDETLMFI